ncbi:hypothetical protein PUN28_008028 [Cardiocondyla obscurior]|uniref:Ribosomal protein S18 n=1 Tax=Cardiocondyla obscurior TaxID=286306 RepID=A0AAW2FYW4_9HYME
MPKYSFRGEMLDNIRIPRKFQAPRTRPIYTNGRSSTLCKIQIILNKISLTSSSFTFACFAHKNSLFIKKKKIK